MGAYLRGIDAVSGGGRNLARATDVLGWELTRPGRAPSRVGAFLADLHADAPPVPRDGVGTLVGAAAGAILWPEHRVLGFLGGASIGRNVPALLLYPGARRVALGNLAQTGGGIVGSLVFPAAPVIGFAIGWIAAGAATYYGGLWPQGSGR